MSSQDISDFTLPADPIFPIGSTYTTPHGGAVCLNEDGVVEFSNTYGEHMAMMAPPLDVSSQPFNIYVSPGPRKHSSTFSHYPSIVVDDHPTTCFEDQTAETFQDMVRVAAIMLGYDKKRHTWDVTSEDFDTPLSEIVLFRHAAETMLGRSKKRRSKPKASKTPGAL